MGADRFDFKQFAVRQERCAMKVGTDATLLGAWARVPAACTHKPAILDIGTGTGIIALMMAQRFAEASVTAIDIDPDAAAQAADNAAASPFAGRIGVICTPVQQYCGGPFAAIVCNPPYFDGSLQSPDRKRTLSRHTASLTYAELASHAYRLLRADGEFSVIIPADQTPQMDEARAIAGFFEVRRSLVRTKQGAQPKRIMLAYAKAPHPIHETEELTLGDARHKMLTADFYL